MVRFEIVGLNDCPWYAKACKLADEIVGINTMVEFNREMMDRFHWNEYRAQLRAQRGWDIRHSPVIFEVLVDNSGKAFLIGDCNDFCEFAAMYFDIYYDPSSSALHSMSLANKSRFGRLIEGEERGDSAIFNISIINAPLKLVELILTQLLSPVSMVPPGVLFNINIYDEATETRMLQGVVMEATDMASPFLFKISVSSTLQLAFYQCHLIILGEDFSRELTEEDSDWISRVELKVTTLTSAMKSKKVKLKDCRVIVGGEGPQCYIAEMIRKALPYSKSSPGRIVASGQYIAQKAKCELSKIGNIPGGCIARIHAWGWPGETGAYVEVKDAVLKGADVAVRGPGVEIPLAEVATNSDYIFKKFSKEFLRLQRKGLKYAFSQPKRYMPLAESITSTIHIWLASEKIVHSSSSPDTLKKGDGDHNPILPSKGPLPVLNLGVCYPPSSTFPDGTFMVQPSVCVEGRWQPLGIISEKTHKKVELEVNKLWLLREKLIYRDKQIETVFPDFDALMGPQDLDKIAEEESLASTQSMQSQDKKKSKGNISKKRKQKGKGQSKFPELSEATPSQDEIPPGDSQIEAQQENPPEDEEQEEEEDNPPR